jgi:hypothetical protein
MRKRIALAKNDPEVGTHAERDLAPLYIWGLSCDILFFHLVNCAPSNHLGDTLSPPLDSFWSGMTP